MQLLPLVNKLIGVREHIVQNTLYANISQKAHALGLVL